MDRQGQRMPPARGEGDGLIRPASSDVIQSSEVTSPGVEEYARSVAQSSPVQRVREAGIQQPGIGIPNFMFPTVMDPRLQVLQELTDRRSVQNRETWPPHLPATSVSSAAVQRQYIQPGEIGRPGGTANLDIYNYVTPLGFGLPGRRPPPPSQTSIFATEDWSPRFPDLFHHQYFPTQPIPSSVSSPRSISMPAGYPLFPVDYRIPEALTSPQSRFDYRRLAERSSTTRSLEARPRPQLIPTGSRTTATDTSYTVTFASANPESQSSKQGRGILQWAEPPEEPNEPEYSRKPPIPANTDDDIIQLSSSDDDADDEKASEPSSRQDPIEETSADSADSEVLEYDAVAVKEESSSDDETDGSESSVDEEQLDVLTILLLHCGNDCLSEETFYEEIGSDDEELSLMEVDPGPVEEKEVDPDPVEEEKEPSMLLEDIVGFSLENFTDKLVAESIIARADVAPPSTLNAETEHEKLISYIQKGSPEVCGMEEEVEEAEAAQKLELALPKIALTDMKIEMQTIGEIKNNAVEEQEKSDLDAKLEIPKDDLVPVQADEACASYQSEPAPVPISSGKSSPYNTQLSVRDALRLKLIETKFLQNENGPGPSLLYTHLVQFYTTANTTSKMMITGTLDICSVVETRLKEDFDLKGNTVVKSVDELKASSVDSLLQFTSFIYIKDCDGEVTMEVVVNDLAWLSNAVPASKVDLLCWRSTKSRDGNYPLVSDVAYFADMTRVITTPVYHDKPKLVKTILEYCANRYRRQVRLDQLIGAEKASLRF